MCKTCEKFHNLNEISLDILKLMEPYGVCKTCGDEICYMCNSEDKFQHTKKLNCKPRVVIRTGTDNSNQNGTNRRTGEPRTNINVGTNRDLNQRR